MSREVAGVGCLVVILQVSFVAFGIWISSLLFQYIVWSVFHKDVAWFIDLAGGIVCSAFVVPVAFLCWIAQALGYAAPLIR